MATGAGKTFTAVTAVCRPLKFSGAKRFLFLAGAAWPVNGSGLPKQPEQGKRTGAGDRG